jgi:hypothetical protein
MHRFGSFSGRQNMDRYGLTFSGWAGIQMDAEDKAANITKDSFD